MSQDILHAVTGCTAVGKTEWAIGKAEEIGAEIVSCDSLLFYRGMDIGTAKPSAEDRARVRHHLIDIRGVTDPMDVVQYASAAAKSVEDIVSRGRKVLVVGGSGFYLKSFFAPVADDVEVPEGVRRRVADLIAGGGLQAALDELRSLNSEGLGKLEVRNPRRVARALERCLASGRSLRSLAEEFARQPGPFAGWRLEITVLERPADELSRRIESRAGKMVAAGLLDETRRLLAAGLGRNPSAARAIGYRESIAVLEGRMAERDLAGEIARNTRALAKKQRTWFRTQLPPAVRINPD